MAKDEETPASLPNEQTRPARLPGTWQALVIAALSAALVGYWAKPGAGAATAAGVSRVAEVTSRDETAALNTIAWSHEQQDKFRRSESCGRRLAWVTLMRGPGQPPGRIRLQSGAYVSPAFELAETPVRVALPYPAPYPTGHGTISVVGTTSDAIVALVPPWHVPAQPGPHAQEVTWTPSGDCPSAGK